jgi:type I restriction enzyme S subunit
LSEGDLPPGWVETDLGTIRLDLSQTIEPAVYSTRQFELYSIPAFPTGKPEIVAGSEIGSAKKTLLTNTVIVSKINPRINRVWIVKNDSAHQKVGSSEWIPFFALEGILPDYLAYSLRRDHFRNFLAANVSGVGGSLMRVRPEVLSPYPLPLPPLPEQRRIVAAIESYLTRLDDAIASLERVQRNLKRYRASVLQAAVEGRLVPSEAELARESGREYEPASDLLKRILVERREQWLANAAEKGRAKAEEKAKAKGAAWSPDDDAQALAAERKKAEAKYVDPAAPDTSDLPELPDGWCWASVEQISIQIKNGCSVAPTAKSGVPILRISAVRPLSVNLRDVRFLPGPFDHYKGDQIASGDLLFTRYNGNPELVGVSGLVRNLNENVIHPDKLIRVRCLNNFPDRRYLEIAVNIGTSRQFIEKRIRTTAGQAGISGGDVKGIPIPIPPLLEQRRISDEVERLLSIETGTKQTTTTNLARAKRLRQSILKWAFEGKLVDQDPNDEPAWVLLERIKTERAEREAAEQATRNAHKTSTVRKPRAKKKSAKKSATKTSQKKTATKGRRKSS